MADLVLTDQYFVDVTSIDTGVVSKVPYAPLVKGTSGQPRDGFNNVPLVSSGASANKPCDAALLSTPAFVAGKIVLIYDYSCFPSINAAVVAVKAAGAAAAIWCFEHMPKTPLPMQHVGISATYTNFTVWSMRTDRDCAPIHSSLLAGSNLTMSMVGSGTIDPNEKLALKAIARGMMGTASWALEAINRPWTDYVTNDADPCQFPLQGIWCENGHVVAVYFVVNGLVSPLLPEWGALSKLKYMKMNQAGWYWPDAGVVGQHHRSVSVDSQFKWPDVAASFDRKMGKHRTA